MLIGAVSWACAPETIELVVPGVERATSAIVAFDTSDGRLFEAIDLAAGGLAIVRSSDSEDVGVTVLLLEPRLAELDLADGPITPWSGVGPSHGLPRRFLGAYERAGDDWRPLSEVPEAFASLKIAGPLPNCPQFKVETAQLPGDGFNGFAVPVEQGVLLTVGGAVQLLHADGRTSSVAGAGLEYRDDAAAYDSAVRLWVAGNCGRVGRADSSGLRGSQPTLQVSAVPEVPVDGDQCNDEVQWLAVRGTRDDHIDVVTLSKRGVVDRFADGAWGRIGKLKRPGTQDEVSQDRHCGQLVTAGGDFIGVHFQSSAVARGDRIDQTDGAGYGAAAFVSPYGPMIAEVGAGLRWDRAGTWTALPHSDHGIVPCVMLPYANGVLLAGESGVVMFAEPGVGACDVAGGLDYTVKHLLVFRGRVVAVGDRHTGTAPIPAFRTFLDPR